MASSTRRSSQSSIAAEPPGGDAKTPRAPAWSATHLVRNGVYMVSLPRITPRETVITAADGFELGATVIAPPRPRATLVIHGATATKQTYYARFAAYAAARGHRVVTYDYRGVGASRPRSLIGFDATMS